MDVGFRDLEEWSPDVVCGVPDGDSQGFVWPVRFERGESGVEGGVVVGLDWEWVGLELVVIDYQLRNE